MFNENNERIPGTFDGKFYDDMMRGKKGNATFDAPRRTKKKSPNKNEKKMPKHMRNCGKRKPCPCGSGKRFKNCCLLKYKSKKQAKSRPNDKYDFDFPSS